MFIISALMMAAYIGLLKYEAGYPELHLDDPNAPIDSLPDHGADDQEWSAFPVAGGGPDLAPHGRKELSPALSALLGQFCSWSSSS